MRYRRGPGSPKYYNITKRGTPSVTRIWALRGGLDAQAPTSRSIIMGPRVQWVVKCFFVRLYGWVGRMQAVGRARGGQADDRWAGGRPLGRAGAGRPLGRPLDIQPHSWRGLSPPRALPQGPSAGAHLASSVACLL